MQEAKERDAAAKRAMERAAEEYAAEAKKMAAIAAAAPKPAPAPKEKNRPARPRNKKKQNPEEDFWVRSFVPALATCSANTLLQRVTDVR